jgi:hypothetical protein
MLENHPPCETFRTEALQGELYKVGNLYTGCFATHLVPRHLEYGESWDGISHCALVLDDYFLYEPVSTTTL